MKLNLIVASWIESKRSEVEWKLRIQTYWLQIGPWKLKAEIEMNSSVCLHSTWIQLDGI